MICKKCDIAIEEGARYFIVDEEGGAVCEDCFIEYAVERIQDDVEHTAEMLGVRWNYNSDPFGWDDARDRREY